MCIWRFLSVVGIASAILGSPAGGQVQVLTQAVSTDSLRVTVKRLVAFDTRFVGSDSNWAAALYLCDRLAAMGYETRLDTFEVNIHRVVSGQSFDFTGLEQVNVIGTKLGLSGTGGKIVVSGHYDSISLDRPQSAQDVAPGADDNASGVAGVLEIARLLADQRLDRTVEFALWGAEELGLIGSTAYANRAQANGEEIALMIGLDVIGDPGTLFPGDFSIDTTPAYEAVAQSLVEAAALYSALGTEDGNGNALRLTSTGCRCSDHQPFLDRGFPAVGIFQFFDNPSPHINMSTDTVETVNFNYLTEVTRAVLGGVLDLAGISETVAADFNVDGTVDFADFILFAARFGLEVLDGETAIFDLDGNGFVGFRDFLLFADAFEG